MRGPCGSSASHGGPGLTLPSASASPPGESSASPPGESGYEGWLRYRRVPDPAKRALYARWCARVVLPGASDVAQATREELVRGLGGLLGRAPQLSTEPPLEGGYLLASTVSEELGAAALQAAGVAAPSPEGYVVLGPEPPGEGRQLSVVGGDDAGCLYGVFSLLRRLHTGAGWPSGPLVERPALAWRVLDHWDNLDGSVERGYAGRSVFFRGGEVTGDYQRLADYARLLASVGVNTVCPNNVNVGAEAMELLTARHLPGLARLATVFRRYGVRMSLAVGFSSPIVLGGLPTADPLDPGVRRWWAEVASRVYSYIPDMAGFVVKADSELRAGPHSYGRDHAEGANMLAEALAPYGGAVFWRAFVYNCQQDWRDRGTDRAKAAYEEFVPLDGRFAPNVFLQVKQGPMDFQVREPPSPLLGAMPATSELVEVQLTQEYTGQQVHLCYLAPAWKEVLDFPTRGQQGPETVSSLVKGAVGVANVGDEPNWTGHYLAQANLYAFGRLTWCPSSSPEEVAAEWARLSFGGDPAAVSSVTWMLMASRPAYEAYTSPLGLGWMVTPGSHYGPSPDGYEYSRWGTYHYADSHGVGVDRTVAHGSGFAGQYHEPWKSIFEDPATCPEELLLFFHHVAYSHVLSSGRSLVQHIYDSHFEGVQAAEELLARWDALSGRIDAARHEAVRARLVAQLEHAREWRDVVNAYFHRKSGIPDSEGRPLY